VNENYHVSVSDVISNQVVFTKNGNAVKGENDFAIDLSALHNGFYVLHLISDSMNYIERIEIRK
jgi:hypothetical protein